MKMTVQTLQDMFEESEQVTYTARQEAERARDYVDGKQFTDAELTELGKRKQPPIIVNRVRRKIEWLKGLEVTQRTDPKAFPRSPKHEQSAEAITDALRFVAENTDWDRKRSQAWENMLIEGFGGVEVVHKKNRRGEVEVVVNHYPWDRLFYDPHSRQHDFSDARYRGAVMWMDKAELAEQFEGKKADIEAISEDESDSETFDDRPSRGRWYDRGRKRVRVVLMWHREGDKWKYCQFTKGVKLSEGDSPYIDADGESVCPLIMESAYVGRNNDRYGPVRDMFGPQDEINKRRSKALHAINTNQIIASEGMFADESKIRREAAKPDGLMIVSADPEGRFEIRTNGELAASQMALLQEAKNEIDAMGANSALEGETGENTSGRAVLARQQGGMIEIASLMDRLHNFTRRVYEQMWGIIRQFWTEERWVRVTDDERNVRFVGLNRPVTLQEKLEQMPPEQVAGIAQRLMLVPNDPRLQMPVEVENQVEEIDVDIIVEEVPDRVTLQGETFEAMLRYAQSGAIPPQVLIEADPSMPASKKEKLLELMEQQAQQPNPMMEAEMQGKQASAAKDMAQAQKYQAEAQQPAIGF